MFSAQSVVNHRVLLMVLANRVGLQKYAQGMFFVARPACAQNKKGPARGPFLLADRVSARIFR
jgi:hypothetical protein